MKRNNVFLSLAAAAAIICGLFTACSSGESGADVPESDMPQLTVNISESAQTTPETPAESESTGSASAAEETLPADTDFDTAFDITAEAVSEEDEAAERHETAVLGDPDASAVESAAPAENAAGENEGRNGIVQLAAAQEGKPFYFGGTDPESGFDNSGLIYYVLNRNGIVCPRLTFEIAEMGTKIGYDELQAGDVVFFEYEGSGKADFGGIYIGGGMMIVSTDEDRPVSKVDITTDYYRRTFQYGIVTY
ncbi:MAG: NlpC/P60 family protein [Bacteroides sp.]|nr:NlpC/P60 family protein [Bacteroides sp.]